MVYSRLSPKEPALLAIHQALGCYKALSPLFLLHHESVFLLQGPERRQNAMVAYWHHWVLSRRLIWRVRERTEELAAQKSHGLIGAWTFAGKIRPPKPPWPAPPEQRMLRG